MISILRNGRTCSYATFDDMKAVSSESGLSFFRETIEICQKNDAPWIDLTNDLYDSGGEHEAEALLEMFKDPTMRRWVLVALVLNGLTDEKFIEAIADAESEKYEGLISWLTEVPTKTHDSDAAFVQGELNHWQRIVDARCEEERRAAARARKEREAAARAVEERAKRNREAAARAAEEERARKERAAARAAEEVVNLLRERATQERKRRFTAPYVVFDLMDGNLNHQHRVEFLDEMPKGGWKDLYKTTKLVLRRISGGDFMMGSRNDERGRSGDELRHRVILTEPFYLGIFPVTIAQWNCVRLKDWSLKDETIPIHGVSYNDIRGGLDGCFWPDSADVDAKSFLGWLRRLTACPGFDLPTEVQWEYACRAGSTTPYSCGKSLFWTQANYGGGTGRPTAVGTYHPNGWGIYDMHGNVMEWCRDWYGTYHSESEINHVGPQYGDARVARGGDWTSREIDCRSASRDFACPGERTPTLGFRLCCSNESIQQIIDAQ